MKKNMAVADRIIRVIIALAVAALYFTGVINGIVAVILGVIALVFVITSFVGTCPIYSLLGISTKKEDK